MDTILCNIGNTHTSACLWNGKEIKKLFTVPTGEFSPDMLDANIPVAAACVVPAVRKMVESHRSDVFWVSSANCSGKLDFSLVDASTLGADRVANAVALTEYVPLPALVVDCGTAITIEIVDQNRCFRGGAIAPGRLLMRKALFNGTAQLPDIPLSEKVPEFAGVDTVSSMCFGIDRGAVGIVRQLIAGCCAQYGIRRCVATGGDAGFFLDAIPELESADEFFTFNGIRIAAGV
ncbi:MAG: type III pantothenate kinase [Lentisphaeria bacterium]|nr:type III pantothenate kinase [Lentisphaeria bacterium]MBO7153482.1 type III pantothenate kinase [Lentisphaeria bacterium]MBR2632149.1 type III pantothenate kinase [Lentisphaeria bacterium]